MYAASKRYYKTELSSYALESTLHWAMRKGADGPPLIFGDLHHKVTDTLVHGDTIDMPFTAFTALRERVDSLLFSKSPNAY